jgi:hypothetical protein
MAKDFQQLRNQASIIRDETQKHANTAERIGNMFLDIIDKIEAQCVCSQESPTTDITVEFTTAETNQTITDAVRLGTDFGEGRAIINWGDGNMENIQVQPIQAVNPGQPTGFNQPAGVSHTYSNPGTYTVNIKAYSEVRHIRFSTLTGNENYYPTPVALNYLTRIVHVESSTLTNLDYMFAGQSGCANLASNFALQISKGIPLLEGTFYRCKMTQIPVTLLSQISAGFMFWTFREMGLSGIPEDLFAGKVSQSLSKTVDLFRGNPLQSYPQTLLRNCTNLYHLEGMYNNTDFIGPQKAVGAEILKGTNASNLDAMFYNANRIVVVDNFLQYAPHVTSMRLCFYSASWAGLWGTEGWSGDLNKIFPNASYPNMKDARNAFSQTYTFDQGNANTFKGDAAVFVAKFPNIFKPGNNSENIDGRSGALTGNQLSNTSGSEAANWM